MAKPAIKTKPETGIEKVLRVEGGKFAAVAAKLTTDGRKCDRQLVEYWEEKGYVTPNWALRVNEVYGVPLHELNPAIYPKSL